MADDEQSSPAAAATKREREEDTRRVEALRAARLRAEPTDVPAHPSDADVDQDEHGQQSDHDEGDDDDAGSRKEAPYGPFLTEAAARADVFVGVEVARPASPLFAAPPSAGAYRERSSGDPDDDDDATPRPTDPLTASPQTPLAATDTDVDDVDDAAYWRQVARLGVDASSSPFELLFERGLDARAQPPADDDVADLVDALRTLAVRGPERPEKTETDLDAPAVPVPS